jgi:succinyl-diaminopimelate desuccinylase
MVSATVELAQELVRRQSITPEDGGCQDLIATRLAKHGFTIEPLNFGETSNLWARHGSEAPLLVLLGHTDVVPTGPLEKWEVAPFEGIIKDDYLWGRGAADMKGGLAAMVVAAEQFVAKHPNHKGSIAFLITSDEEGDGIDGTVKVVEHLIKKGEKIDYCLVGEPSSTDTAGDTVKNGRRGSLTGKLLVKGVQGHVAYPQRADNPIHRLAPALAELCAIKWDDGNEFFDATSFQISNLNAGTGADNVIPAELRAIFNFRFSTQWSAAQLQERVSQVLDLHSLDYQIEWRLSGNPFLTRSGKLVDATREAIRSVLKIETTLSTTGGTSDGRFVAPTGAEVVELGPVNATIHKINECVAVQDLNQLALVYEKVLESLLI